MGDVVSINSKKFLGGYCSAQQHERLPEYGFLLGVLVTVVVPQIAYCANGGPISPLVFAAGAVGGMILGLVKYYLPPAPVGSCVDARTATRPPQRDVIAGRKLS